ncbi:MAG: OmpH family outer membrane protein [Bacteroidales bacterium]|nr:OmpH family outer membrane protein [Bacteroidales bacterium]
MEINQDLNKPVDDNSLDTISMKEPQEQRPSNPEPTPNAESPATQAPEEPKDNCCTKKRNCCHTAILVCNIVLLIGLILLYIFHFTGIGTRSMHNPNATAPVVAKDGALKIACIDSDTLLAKYQYAIDLQEELNKYKDAQEKNYQQQVTKFQKDYQTYLQTGENMTLSQQQATEAELKQRSEKLTTLEAELTQKVMQKQLDANIELLNRIFAFVREYNAANQQFDIIMRKTFNDSPTLYMNPAMDITNEIIEGLNEEYKTVKGKKASK